MRGQMWSPGRPSIARRGDRVRFWEAIARGVSSEDAAGEVGVSPVVGVRWFRQAGGMPPICLGAVSGRYLSFAEREEIAIFLAQGVGVRERHRSVQTLTKRPGRRRRGSEQSTPQDPRLEDPRRNPQRTPTLPPTKRCCNNPLNPGWEPRFGVEDHLLYGSASDGYGHVDRGFGQLGGGIFVAESEPQYSSGEQVWDCSQIHRASLGVDVFEVPTPFLVGPLGGEIAA